MKYRMLIFFFFVSLNIFSQKKNDTTEIIQLLKEDYKTMVTHDSKKHTEFCTTDYLLIEDGEIWNMEMEVESYRKNANRIIERTDNFDFKYIKVEGNTAYAVYNLKSDIKENGKLTRKNWNESVIFRKTEGKWKIALIHSTPVNL